MDTTFVTDEQKRFCVLNAKTLLKMFPKYSKNSFNDLTTSDETWVYYFEPERKCSNRVWATKNDARPRVSVLSVIFFDNKGPVMQ